MKPPFNLSDVVELGALPKIEILDIGAMIEGEALYATLMEQGLGSVTGFEPNPEELAKLKAQLHGDYRGLPDFLGSGASAELRVTHHPGCSSLYEPDPEIIDRFVSIGASGEGGNFRVVDRNTVQTTKLDDVAACPPVDYVYIDVQGSELDVLTNGLSKYSESLVIETEVEFLPIYKDQPLFGDIHVFLRENGFVFHKFIDIVGRYIRPAQPKNIFSALSQVPWADAVFVRDFPSFESYSDEQFIKAAIILHHIYLSYNLSNLILIRLDIRLGTDLAKKYQKVIASVQDLQRYYMNLEEEGGPTGPAAVKV